MTLKAQPQWCTFESPAFAYAILEKPLVGEMDEPFVIHEKDQSGRIDCWLCGVVELEAFACLGWRAVTSNGLRQYVIELAGGYALVALLVDSCGRLQYLMDALPCHG